MDIIGQCKVIYISEKFSSIMSAAIHPSSPDSPTTVALWAFLNRPPSPLPIPVPLTSRQFFPLPISPDSSKYIILSPDSTPSSPIMSEISSPNASPSPIPFPLISRQFFPSSNFPNSFHHIILSPDSTPPSPSSPRNTKTPPPPSLSYQGSSRG